MSSNAAISNGSTDGKLSVDFSQAARTEAIVSIRNSKATPQKRLKAAEYLARLNIMIDIAFCSWTLSE